MSFWRRREVQGTVLVLPYILIFALFVLYPLIRTVVSAFTGGTNPLANYMQAFSMPSFRMAMLHTLGYTVIASLLVVALAFPISFLVYRVLNRHKRLRYLIAMPYAASAMALAMIWLMFFNQQNGLANKLLPLFGLSAQNWLESPGPAFLCVLSLVFWRSFCFTVFNCLQAMETQPKEIYESAAIAGANSRQTFMHITLPQLVPTMFYVIPTTVISALTTFEPIMLLYYAGMDVNQTGSLVYLYYQQATIGSKGVASAIAVLLLVPIMICCYAYSRYIFGRKAAK